MDIQFCTECFMPNSRPRVVFNQLGVCNACTNAIQKQGIDWEKREVEFHQYVEKYRAKSGLYDCIVPWSGGKDSSSIAYKLKFEFGLNPLLVTFSPLLPNNIGGHNCEAFLKLGFDHIMLRPNQKVARRLSKRFFIERGNPKVAWDAGINATPIQIAVKFNIPLVFYAEHGESEYGGHLLSEEHRKIRDFSEVLEHQIGDDPNNWVDNEINEKDLSPYLYPDPEIVDKVGVKAMYFGYFFKWSMYENYEFLKNKMDFRLAEGGRTSGTYTNYDSLDDKMDNLYFYMQYIKFGFGRATRDSARHIQNGHMDRSEAFRMIQKYDHEFPKFYFEDVLEYLNITSAEFTDIVDRHRNHEIWDYSNTQWKLRFPPSL